MIKTTIVSIVSLSMIATNCFATSGISVAGGQDPHIKTTYSGGLPPVTQYTTSVADGGKTVSYRVPVPLPPEEEEGEEYPPLGYTSEIETQLIVRHIGSVPEDAHTAHAWIVIGGYDEAGEVVIDLSVPVALDAYAHGRIVGDRLVRESTLSYTTTVWTDSLREVVDWRYRIEPHITAADVSQRFGIDIPANVSFADPSYSIDDQGMDRRERSIRNHVTFQGASW